MLPIRRPETDPDLAVRGLLAASESGAIGRVGEQPLSPPRDTIVPSSTRTADAGQRGADFRRVLLDNYLRRGL